MAKIEEDLFPFSHCTILDFSKDIIEFDEASGRGMANRPDGTYPYHSPPFSQYSAPISAAPTTYTSTVPQGVQGNAVERPNAGNIASNLRANKNVHRRQVRNPPPEATPPPRYATPPYIQYAPPPSFRSQTQRGAIHPVSWLASLLFPSSGFVAAVLFGSVAIIYLSYTLSPVIRGVGDIASAVSTVSVWGTLQPVTSLAKTSLDGVGTFYCNTISVGCMNTSKTGKRDRASTKPFDKLPTTGKQPEDQSYMKAISLGNDFFDCLRDLTKTREHQDSTAHILTLVPKVHQIAHVLENSMGIRSNLEGFAEARTNALYGANDARVQGTSALKSFFEMYKMTDDHHALKDSASEDPGKFYTQILDRLESDIDSMGTHTIVTKRAIETADRFRKLVSEQLHQEIGRMKDLNDKARGSKLWFFKSVVGAAKVEVEARIEAMEVLSDIIHVLDNSVNILLSSNMAMAQCDANQRAFKEGLEHSLNLREDNTPPEAQLRLMGRLIGSLSVQFTQYLDAVSDYKGFMGTPMLGNKD